MTAFKQIKKGDLDMKKNSSLFLILFLIILLVSVFVWVALDNSDFNDQNDDQPKFQTKSITESDFSVSVDSDDWIFVHVTITPHIDIKNITLRVIYYDNNDEILKSEYITSYDLKGRIPHKQTIKNNFMESLKIKDWKVEFLSGTKA